MKIIILSVLLLSIAVAATSSYELDDEQENNDRLDDLMDQRSWGPCARIFGKRICFDCRPLCKGKKLKCGRLSNRRAQRICIYCRHRCSRNRQSPFGRLMGDVENFDDLY